MNVKGVNDWTLIALTLSSEFEEPTFIRFGV